MAEIPLTDGKVALVDDDDHERVSHLNWRAKKDYNSWYAISEQRRGRGNREFIRLHRFILRAPSHMQVDHINGDGLDNRKKNLRLATNAENGRNSRRPRNNTSGYKGVSRHKRRWRAQICVNRHTLMIGTFDTAEEAARAYDAAALYHFGEFARLNFPTCNERTDKQ